MTWKEIKEAVEKTGVSEDDELVVIECDLKEGDHTFHKVRLGQMLKLIENFSVEKLQNNEHGCAV